MRGLPGSGKSTLADRIVGVYKGAKVCSADHFFTQPNGAYAFDASKLEDAHKACQSACSEAMRSADQSTTVVVDNTNVQFWEMRPYFSLAKQHRYHVILTEPKTPWKLDPKILADRNTHQVSYKDLRHKVKQYRVHIRPMYFAWFLNPSDSRDLLTRGNHLLTLAAESCDALKKSLNTENVCQFFNRDKCSDQGLHCTAKFLSKNTKADPEFMSQACGAVGTVTSLKVTSLIISPRTFGAKVVLNEQQASTTHKAQQVPFRNFQ